MKLIAYSFTDKGEEIGRKLVNIGDLNISHKRNKDIAGGVKEDLKTAYSKYNGIIFISASGIAVRLILPYIKDKHRDLPILVIDDMGKFCISLLAGHVGGANELASDISDFLGAIAVITTASDNRGFQAIDKFAKDNNYYINNKKDLTKVMAMMVNGKKIGLLANSKNNIDYSNFINLKSLDLLKQSNAYKDIEAIIIIEEDIEKPDIDLPYIKLKKKDINIGVGCKKGISSDRIIKAIKDEMDKMNISSDRIRAMGTIEVKKNEKGLIEAAKYFKCPLKIFLIKEVLAIEDMFEKSDFVKSTIGVYSVSEPAAYLLGGELLVRKARHDGITISISKE